MSQLSFSSFDSSLLVRDAQGRYLPASVEKILEAARQVIDQKMRRGTPFTSSMLVKEYLSTKLAGFEHEVFAVLFLDSQHRLIEYVEMFRGTIDSASVHPREVVKEALRFNAAAVIFSHNHPSGNPRRLTDALALVDVRTLDHIIVAGNATASFAERELL
ncbi:JAB domain-containing protein [Cupriavidus sp. YAF13]|uniref:JAB domain-containing protein n=1 Tax=Cupriavidus sp. YAF13 TaxID=3233075 RepID=UPI003F8E15E5